MSAAEIPVSGIVLAGGTSRRMGRDKLSLRVGGEPLLARVHSVLGRICDEVVIVGDGGSEAVPNARRVPDRRSERQGPLAGLEAGLEVICGEIALVVAGDMPFVGEALLRHLAGIAERGEQAVVPVEGDRLHPLCAAYRRETLEVARTALDSGTRDMRGFISALERVSYVPVGDGAFVASDVILMNVNSPKDLAKARQIAGDSGD